MTLTDPHALAEQARVLLARRRARTLSAQTRLAELTATLGQKQAAFLQSTAPRQALDGSRQSGKSHTLATKLIKVGFARKCESMYVAPTSKSARKAVWSKFYALNDQFRLGIDMREGAFEARFPNGSLVGFEGAHDKARVQRLRGATLTGVLCVDESAFFPEQLLKELLGPVATAMFLTSKQQIVVASSPGLQRRGRFFELVHDETGAWEHHHLTAGDNPAIKDVKAALLELREANAWTETTPAYMREGLGLWVDDATHNVYDLTELNLLDSFPEGPWTTIMLVDFGKNDQSAIAIAGWREHDPSLYVLHVEGQSDLDIEDVCQLALPLIERWDPIGVYGDPGGGGAQHMDYMRRRHKIPIRPVSKKPNYKAPAIRDLNADMRRGHYKVLRSSPLVDQMQSLQWDPQHIGLHEHPSMPNDLCDVAGVYAFVQAGHYRAEARPEPAPPVGTAEHLQRLSDEGLAAAIAAANQHNADLEAIEEEHAFLTGNDWE